MALTALAAVFNVFSSPISQLFSDIWELDRNIQLLKDELDRLKQRLLQIKRTYEYQQRQLSPLVEEYLEWTNNALEKADALKVDADRERERHQPGLLLQPLPDSGLVGSGIEASQQQLLTWLNEPHPQARVIGVWGMGGVGKTALLRLIYNQCQVSRSFDFVIWHTISQNYQIQSLQDAIAESLKLTFEPSYSTDLRKMKLYASLKNKRFLLVLDDLWSQINLKEVGVNLDHDKNGRVLISSRNRDVVEKMAEKEYCMMIPPLSKDEGWELFQKTAFKSGAAQDKSLEVIARQVAWECKGLPLAINTVAAAIARKKTAEEWSRALVLMENADPSFPSTHPTIDTELYQRLRWSFNDLPNHDLKMCFLYCAAFPEDAEIAVETLVEMWTAERLVPRKGITYFMDVGREYIQLLVDRCLIEYVDAEKKRIKVHDVLRLMAIHVGQGEENWLFEADQHLKDFPSEEVTRDCKRISVLGKISYLPPDLKCPTLVSLMLAGNRRLKEIPEGFLVNCMSLKVLDLSFTSLKTLPTAVGQLGKLEFLNLSWCDQLEDLPDSICDLSHLQFLNLELCESLYVLPDRIGKLKNLKHLTISGGSTRGVTVIPHQISQLTSLNKLVLPFLTTPLSLEELTNLSNLIELNVTVKPEIKGGSMSTWSKMRKLRLRFEWGEDEKRDDAALDILPENMQSMEELQSLELFGYQGASLPTCISQFRNLKNLNLRSCMNLEELPRGGFPELQRLILDGLDRLESVVCNAKTMSQLQTLNITYCSGLKTLRMEELPNLRELDILRCVELKELFMESGGGFPELKKLYLDYLVRLETLRMEQFMPQLHSLEITCCAGLKAYLRIEEFPDLQYISISRCRLLKVEIGSLPMLKELRLEDLKKAESIARPSSVWNSDTMPNLEFVQITGCPLLRRMPREMETLPKLKKIVGNLDWWNGISWENDNVKSELSHLFRDVKSELSHLFGEESDEDIIEESDEDIIDWKKGDGDIEDIEDSDIEDIEDSRTVILKEVVKLKNVMETVK